MSIVMGVDIGGPFTDPAIVEQPDSTTVVTPGMRARVDEQGNQILEEVK